MSPSSIDTLMAALDRYAGLLQTLDDPARQMGPQIVWTGPDDLVQTAQLNRAYLVIGMTALDDDTHRYLFLDRAGRCGALWFNQDCIDDEHLETLHQMMQTSPARSDFCTALAAEVQVAIERLHPRHVTVRA